MLKTISKGLSLFAAIFALSACDSVHEQPQQGKQYELLPVSLQKYDLAPVTEIFSLTCGHCRKMEHVIPQLESMTGQSFDKLHVMFNESAQISAIIFYTAVMQSDGMPDKAFMAELFAAMQMGPDATGQERKAAIELAFTKRQLVSPYELDQSQQKVLLKYMSTAEQVTTDGQINSVPALIIQGKYRLITSGHDSAEAMADTINYLLELPQ
ncbi:thiol:disulfide interchange protein DsbA/DsbL [Vibrio sp. CAU 1672]|uniref:thiol:disulfide interchange protein DsbA/DsbL n=1 Tax=Vibrio sp. CAU 1672 TaxID=3032594 RepID=UPI0023DBE114|nr:thiol:disulfide interchange protein DsbA/DsbL [Vibrio sp. CAU 1672]MDF2152764.1 thiol:disulfide interchange protein DsbA/DsbL [Vibrio sp. CAU 1672]